MDRHILLERKILDDDLVFTAVAVAPRSTWKRATRDESEFNRIWHSDNPFSRHHAPQSDVLGGVLLRSHYVAASEAFAKPKSSTFDVASYCPGLSDNHPI